MTKVIRGRPGPKSKKSKIISQNASLGESTTDNDDSSAEETEENILTKPPKPDVRSQKKSQMEREDRQDFRTPELDRDATDYGLEFTHSRMQDISPSRCSTFRTQEEQQDAGGRTNRITKEHPEAARKQPTKSKKGETQKHKEPTKSTTETVQNKSPNKDVRKRRKQRNPLQLDKRFWKEVQHLQNRTENLIPMLPFSRLVRELILEASSDVTKITSTAMEALQQSAELYITQRLQDAYMLTLHRGRVTLDVKDLMLINYLKINF